MTTYWDWEESPCSPRRIKADGVITYVASTRQEQEIANLREKNAQLALRLIDFKKRLESSVSQGVHQTCMDENRELRNQVTDLKLDLEDLRREVATWRALFPSSTSGG